MSEEGILTAGAEPYALGQETVLIETDPGEPFEVRHDDGADASSRLAAAVASSIKAREVLEPEVLDALGGDSLAREKLRALAAEWELGDADLRRLVRSLAAKKAFTSEDEHIQMAALKLIAAMPGVGMAPAYAKVQVNVGVGLSPETSALLEGLK